MKTMRYREIIEIRPPMYWGILVLFGLVVGMGLLAALYMESQGHHVTGMNNQIVWGTPHVFAVFLIVAASGVLNAASVASVFGRPMYKPLARLSGLLAITLLVGGLAVLVLDLGRADRLIIAMTHYNFKSIFAWNIFLYTGFMAVVAVYLWMMMERRMHPYSKPLGFLAFLWRITLTTGTGSIFGFLVARSAYDEAILAPTFVTMSLSYGTAIYILVLMSFFQWTKRPLGDAILTRLKNLLGVFVAAVLYFWTVYHVTNLYMAEHWGVERFILLDGGVYTATFWLGQVLLGGLVPLVLFYIKPFSQSRRWLVAGASLVILGGFAQMYVTIIGGQAYPLQIFPGMEVQSSFFDGQVASYTPSFPEIALGIGGIAIALLMTVVAVRVLPFLPETLADRDVDPHAV